MSTKRNQIGVVFKLQLLIFFVGSCIIFPGTINVNYSFPQKSFRLFIKIFITNRYWCSTTRHQLRCLFLDIFFYEIYTPGGKFVYFFIDKQTDFFIL